MSVPNQKKVLIGPRAPRDKSNLYGTVNLDALKEAMINLKETSFKLWCYFNKNQDGYSMELSQKDCESWGIKKTSYYRAIEDLESKGYLTHEEGSNCYIFHEIPERVSPKLELQGSKLEPDATQPPAENLPKSQIGTSKFQIGTIQSQIGTTKFQIGTSEFQIG